MSILSTTLLAFSMSADAFAASLCKGTALRRPSFAQAVRTGAIFGIVEATTPVIGWAIGLAASQWVAAVDHWIAFTILAIIGGKMLFESTRNQCDVEEAKGTSSFGALVLTAIGTSIDAMAVGVSLALLDANIWITALAIGAATFLMATLGMFAGHYLGQRIGRIAEAIGGVTLIAIGTKILFEHLGIFTF